MKRFFIVLVVACFAFVFAGSAMASGPAKKVEYEGKTKGKVVFDGKTHAAAGLKCAECHSKPKLFGMKKAGMKKDDIHKACGTCHEGKKTFAVSECAKCHKK